MKRNDTIRAIGMSVSWTLLLAGCSTESGTDAPQRAIGFTTTVTRSAVTSLGNDGDAFSVWAREIPSGGTPRLILTRETVTCTGGYVAVRRPAILAGRGNVRFLCPLSGRTGGRTGESYRRGGDSVLAHQGFRRHAVGRPDDGREQGSHTSHRHNALPSPSVICSLRYRS